MTENDQNIYSIDGKCVMCHENTFEDDYGTEHCDNCHTMSDGLNMEFRVTTNSWVLMDFENHTIEYIAKGFAAELPWMIVEESKDIKDLIERLPSYVERARKLKSFF
jgi:hypothetical protein